MMHRVLCSVVFAAARFLDLPVTTRGIGAAHAIGFSDAVLYSDRYSDVDERS